MVEKPDAAATPQQPTRNEPSLVPGVVLLALAAVLIVVVLVTKNMEMAGWLRASIAAVAIAVVLALLGYAGFVMLRLARRGRN